MCDTYSTKLRHYFDVNSAGLETTPAMIRHDFSTDPGIFRYDPAATSALIRQLVRHSFDAISTLPQRYYDTVVTFIRH